MTVNSCKGKHQWPRRWSSKLVGWWGRRYIWTCNTCLATKVVIETDQKRDLSVTDKVEGIVEPVDHYD